MTHSGIRSDRVSRLIRGLALVAVMALGAWLRFSSLDWDGMNQLHPDERAILFVASQIEAPSSIQAAFHPAQSSLNPFRTAAGDAQQFPYGHLPLYAMLLAQRLVTLPCQLWPDVCAALPRDALATQVLTGEPSFTRLTFVARAISALTDTLTILVTFLLARQLFHPWAGVLAAAFAAFAVLHIQNAHFGTVDSPLALFSILALWLLARYSESQRLHDTLLAGVSMGLAVGSKATAVLLIVPLLVAHLDFRGWSQLPVMKEPATFLISVAASLLAFGMTNPYAILDPIPFLTSVFVQLQVTSGRVDWPFTRQFGGTIPIIYYVGQQARWLLGLPLTLAAYSGLVWAARRAAAARSRPLFVTLAWVTAMLLTVGVKHAKFPRYLLPLTPVLFCCGAGMLTAPQRNRLRSGSLAALAAVVLGFSAVYAFGFVQVYETPHPWVAASEWIYRDLPPGTRIVSEVWDDPLPLDLILNGRGYLREQSVTSRLIDPFAEPDTPAKLEAVLSEVSASDYVILSSNRLYGVIPRLRERYPLTSAYYYALFSGDLGFALERSFARYPALLGVALVDDPFTRSHLPNPGVIRPSRSLTVGPADESFTVYDHPLVLVFHNIQHLSVEQMQTAIQRAANQQPGE